MDLLHMSNNFLMRNILGFVIVSLLNITCFSQEVISWGDQGDGTFRNPILNSNYPDSDVERYGDKWYMISSTSMFAPGMTILESSDLVNWKLLGHVFDNVSWRSDYDSSVMSPKRGGVWAGDLVFHNGEWFCYVIDPEAGLFVSVAQNIKRPWSEPILMYDAIGWTDPCVFFDYDTQNAYLICHTNTDKETRLYDNKIFKLSWDGRKLLDSGTVFYRGKMAEAAKMYKKDGFYYVFISQWIYNNKTNDRKQLVLRSSNPYGPYESKIVLERGNGFNRSCCQGSLIEAPDGRWWFMHQLVQSKDSYEGRPQFLIPVTWKNNWPVLGEDTDGNGIGNTVWQVKKPIKSNIIIKPQTSDDFNNNLLEPQWSWYYTPDDSKWSLSERSGFLRLYSVKQLSSNEFLKTPNIISQRKVGKGRDTITVKLDFSKLYDGMNFGLTSFAKNYYNIGVLVDCNVCRIYENHNGRVNFIDDFNSDNIYLRLIFEGNIGKFQYSFDNQSYLSSNLYFRIMPSGFMSQRIGLYMYNNKSSDGYIDVDWFIYKYK